MGFKLLEKFKSAQSEAPSEKLTAQISRRSASREPTITEKIKQIQ